MPPKISKIVVRNVGVLKAFDTPASPRLCKLTTIYARNGRGKTTLSSILRSAATGNSSLLHGRKTLGTASEDATVTLVMEAGSVQFAKGKWSTKNLPIEVFDAAFISSNLYAGEAIDLEHDRGLFTVILGEAGVRLVRQQEFFNGVARRAAARLKDADAALRDDIPADQSREDFFAYVPPADLDEQIKRAQMDLKAVQQADSLTRLSKLQTLELPLLSDPTATLAQTLADIESSARDQLAAHFTRFKLGRQGEAWVRFGLEHVHDDECPFCGKEGVDDQGLVTLYGQIFGAAYQTHFEAIKTAADAIEKALGHDGLAALSTQIATNAEAVRSWSEFCDLTSVTLPDQGEALTKLESAHKALKSLFDTKRQTPLVTISDPPSVETALSHHADALKALAAYNSAIEQIDKLIQARKSGASLTEQQAKARLDNLNKRKRRTDPGVQKRISSALKAKRQDTRAKRVRTEVQGRLKTASEASAEHYHSQVNAYLTQFGATFRISKISNSMAGNVGSIDYGLVVRGHSVGRGRRSANDDEPTFKNTLSTGDKTTLAFAFFLASLDRHPDLANRIVVLDDPLSSHDSHRQAKTIDLLDSLCPRTSQVIVLSHDQHFLRRVSKRCAAVDQVSYEIIYEGAEAWSKAVNVDLDQLCESDDERQRRQLLAYYETRAGTPSDVAPAVRKVLETHYRRTYRAYFKPGDNLGPIILSIKGHGSGHPCWGDVADLESCNSGTMNEHHGANAALLSDDPIDPDGLHIIVGTCLRLINAFEPSSTTKIAV
ncbi:AAA family ATPase [Asticcacaulis excentricus]|uniref:Protein CR006 P-loop domain-containing protein n=1 Tax=Asticcacaulis excentricus (strain ATCC 15261 / DSM 4724 / KCTC 12464 / NCIMB 9791 / VKM B-1370 / CB 48) TaxID=573065 RepID=E8RUP3_ASTEC|nr:AAA family ATPase [Asticcacaulis excentricus]ADU14093.1 hypothetical protein Astex_2442 [Asticcacaulis excentricus CB 48]